MKTELEKRYQQKLEFQEKERTLVSLVYSMLVGKDEEPLLKMQHLAGDVQEICESDKYSAIAVSNRFLGLGTQSGKIHLFDLTGNKVSSFNPHAAAVTSISFDESEEFMATSSFDGTVVINNLYSTEPVVFNIKRPVKAVSIEPEYSKSQYKKFAFGGLQESLCLNAKGWFAYGSTVIHSGEGAIQSTLWTGNNLIWSNSAGVRFFCLDSMMKFGFIEKPSSVSRADLFDCHFCSFKDMCYIGWVDQVHLVKISNRQESNGLTQKVVEILVQINVNSIICGIAPRAEFIILLVHQTNLDQFDEQLDDKQEQKPPKLLLIDSSGELKGELELQVTDYAKLSANSYRFAHLEGLFSSDDIYFISSPNAVYIAKPCDLIDKLQFLTSKNRYREAIRVLDSVTLEQDKNWVLAKRAEVLLEYILFLTNSSKWQEAAICCKDFCQDNASVMETIINLFISNGKSIEIYPVIPESFENHELIAKLLKTLISDHSNFRKAVERIKIDFSNILPEFQNELLMNPNNLDLLAAGFIVFEGLNEPKSLICGLRSFMPNALAKLTSKKTEFRYIQDAICLLLDFDQHFITNYYNGSSVPDEYRQICNRMDQSISIPLKKMRAATECPGLKYLLTQISTNKLSYFVDQLRDYSKYLHILLDAIWTVDPEGCADFHDLQTVLYAEYDQQKLLSFLSSSSNYDLVKALQICYSRELWNECVFLQTKMRDLTSALLIILEKIGSIEMAIDFVKIHNSNELEQILVKYSKERPSNLEIILVFYSRILENLNFFRNPAFIIQNIPMEIGVLGLKDSLTRLFSDLEIQKSLMDGSFRILDQEVMAYLRQLLLLVQDSIEIEANVKCCECQSEFSKHNSIVFFNCKHSFHFACLESSGISFKYNIELIESQLKMLYDPSNFFISNPPPTKKTFSHPCPKCLNK